MLGVRWSHALLALPFIVFLLFLDLHKQYEVTLIPLGPLLWPYFDLIISHASFITILLIVSNLMLYRVQFLLVLHLYNYEQSDAPPSTCTS